MRFKILTWIIAILVLVSLCQAWTFISLQRQYRTDILFFQEYNYTCTTGNFTYDTNPLRVYCWNNSIVNGSSTLIFNSTDIDIARYNISTATIWWNYTVTRQVDLHNMSITIDNDGYQYYYCEYPYHQCQKDGPILTCDSVFDGNGDGVCSGGESCIQINLSKTNLKDWKHIKSIYNELRGFDIECEEEY